MPMFFTKSFLTLFLRFTQGLFAVIVLGLTSAFLNKIGFNYDRVTFALVVSILNLIYFIYILGYLSYKNATFSLLILISESLLFIFYLAAMGAVADVMPTNCSNSYFGYYDDSTCRTLQAILPFTLFNWLLFGASLTLFIIYTLVPQIKSTTGFKSTLTKEPFEFGAIYLGSTPITKIETDQTPAVAGEEANIGVATSSENDKDNQL